MTDLHTALVVAANRGIGLAIVRQLLERKNIKHIFATYRKPGSSAELLAIKDERLECIPLDISVEEDIQALASKLRESKATPELVIHCAGILHEGTLQPEKSLRQCKQEDLSRIFLINSIGPLMLARNIIPLMPKNRPGHFAALSAMVGSIGDNRLGGWYGYRASKAALNQFLRTLSIECRRTHPQLCVTAIHPGTTDTSLSKPFQSNVRPGKLYTTSQTAQRILDVVTSGDAQDSGRFVNWDGSTIPW